MSKAKEQLAASLINHWYVVDRALHMGRMKRKPTSSRYKEIASLDFEDSMAVKDIIKSFASFNTKHFIENARHFVDTSVAELGADSTTKVAWSPKILVRGLNGSLYDETIDYNLCYSIYASLTFSRQSPEVSAITELAGSISPSSTGVGTAIGLSVPGFKNTPFCNFQKEEEEFLKVFEAKRFTILALKMISSQISENDRREVMAGRANILIITKSNAGALVPESFSIEETDTARAQRIAKERLEELKRRRTMIINSIDVTEDTITYNTSPLIAPSEHQQLQVSVETLLGW